MRIEYINPFVEASFDILNEILETSVKRGQLYLKKLGEAMKGVAVVIGVTGQVTGRIVFDMNEDTSLKLASKLNKEEFTEFNDMARRTKRINNIAFPGNRLYSERKGRRRMSPRFTGVGSFVYKYITESVVAHPDSIIRIFKICILYSVITICGKLGLLFPGFTAVQRFVNRGWNTVVIIALPHGYYNITAQPSYSP